MSKYQKNPYKGLSHYRGFRYHGISIHEISFWLDGIGHPDRKTGFHPIYSADINTGYETHYGRWIKFDDTSTIAYGNIGEELRSVWFWMMPAKPSVADEIIVNLDGGTNLITRNLGNIETTISGATIYVNGGTSVDTSTINENYFVFVTWSTPVAASNLTIGSNYTGSLTQIMGFTIQVPQPYWSDYYQMSIDDAERVPLYTDAILLEDSSYLVQETGDKILLEL